MFLFLSGCQTVPPALVREAPAETGPFAQFGYRNLRANYIPNTETPPQELARFLDCASSTDQRVASTWIRDWFAAVSRLDRCDQWGIAVLSSAKIRRSLVFILDQTRANFREGESCHKAVFALFTSVEETHSLLSSWHSGYKSACHWERIKEVADKREQAFTQRMASLTEGLEKFKAR
jgi:hypothetical protein